jgi:hypothetical protein
MSIGNNGGRPTDYDKAYPEQARKLCLLGYTDLEMADFFSVCEATINNWKIAHPEFLESIKKGKVFADTDVVTSLHDKALDGDTTAMIFWLKNRQPKKWRDKQEIKQEVNVTGAPLITFSDTTHKEE